PSGAPGAGEGYDLPRHPQPAGPPGPGAGPGYGGPGHDSRSGFDPTAAFDRPGYDPGYDTASAGSRPGFDQPGYDQPGPEQQGYGRPGHDQPGFDQSGAEQRGYDDQRGYDQGAFEPYDPRLADRDAPGDPAGRSALFEPSAGPGRPGGPAGPGGPRGAGPGGAGPGRGPGGPGDGEPERTLFDGRFGAGSRSAGSGPRPEGGPERGPGGRDARPPVMPADAYPSRPHPEPEGRPERRTTRAGDLLPGVAEEGPGGRSRGVAGQGQGAGRLLAAVAWPVMALGLFLPEGGTSAFERIPAWSVFALACLVAVGVGAFGGAQGPGTGRTWTIGAAGAGGLLAFWVLLVLPVISGNSGFALTLGTALAVAALWQTPGRRW
ncbi:MAG TPA: hypothetical protein VFP72_21960, partial [Kineosporiaceae bacterium]|nr:hypothetical protein [Kineosporiaceae bacterium]